MQKQNLIIAFSAALGLFAASCAVPQPGATSAAESLVPGLSPGPTETVLGTLPITFEPNQGQTDAQVDFIGKANGYNLYLTGDRLVFDVMIAAPGNSDPMTIIPGDMSLSTGESAPISIALVGANPTPEAKGVNKLPGVSNYIIGNDPSLWVTNVPSYSKVQYDGIYKGIGVIFYGVSGLVEHDFIVAPGADYTQIKMSIEGAQSVNIREDGKLNIVISDNANMLMNQPIAYQMINGSKQTVEAVYKQNADNTIGFQIGSYDASYELVIDPATLTYSSFLGGGNNDITWGVAVDASGNAYVVGYTKSTNFPGAGTSTRNVGGGKGQGSWDAFVTKLNSSGTATVYSTYLGDTGNDLANSIQLDSVGNVYITGYTTSSGFPTTGGFQTTFGGFYDAFITKLNSSGVLTYSSYLGGADFDRGAQIALDTVSTGCTTAGAPCVVLVGTTTSTGLSVGSVVQNSNGGGGADAFVARVSSSGANLTLLTYLGGIGRELGTGLALDASANVYVTGETRSASFLTALTTTAAPFKTCLSGGGSDTQDAFLAKLPNTLASYTYSGCFGGSGIDGNAGVALDMVSANCTTLACPAVVGTTNSLNATTNFTSTNAYQAANAGAKDIYIAEFNASTVTPTAFNFMTFLGGTADDEVLGFQNIATDSSGKIWITGVTKSSTFISSNTNAISTLATFPGALSSGFVARLGVAGSGSVLNFATYLGGSTSGKSDIGVGIALSAGNNTAAYVTGQAESTNFPTTAGVLQGTIGGGWDGFVSKIGVPQSQAVGTYTGACSDSDGADNIITIAKPTDVQVGDVMLIGLAWSKPLATINSTPAGWTFVNSASYNPGSGNQGVLAVYLKVATASEPSTYTFTLTNESNLSSIGGIGTFRGVDNSSPVDNSSVGVDLGNATAGTVPAPAVVASYPGEIAVTFHAFNRGGTGSTWTPPSSPQAMTELYDCIGGAGGNGITMEMNYAVLASAGTFSAGNSEIATTTAANNSSHSESVSVTLKLQ